MEGSLVAYKVFTNGSVLNASEINDNLMNQSVMVFSNSTARTAALTAPVEGMLTWLQDTNLYEYYNGSAWAALIPASSSSGLTLISKTSFTAVSSHSVNDVFSSTYDNYQILININSSSATTQVNGRLRVSGTDTTSSTYVQGGYYSGAYTSGATGFFNNSTQDKFEWVQSHTTYGAGGWVTLFHPFLTQYTKFVSLTGGSTAFGNQGGNTITTSFTGFTLFPASGNMTGSVSVYGMSNT
jgi:hypothetical protein